MVGGDFRNIIIFFWFLVECDYSDKENDVMCVKLIIFF